MTEKAGNPLAKLSVWVLLLVGAVLCFAFAGAASGQAVAETAGATSVSAAASTSMKAVQMPKFPATNGAGSAHLMGYSALPSPEANVRDFQDHAGKDAGKVLLRAAPGQAQVYVNGKIVGKSPMLLVLAPGKYEIEMRGARGESGKSSVDLLPRETREVVVKLQQLYPGRVTVQH